MYKYTYIIQAIRELAKGKQPEEDITNILYKHNCFYLLSKYKGSNSNNEKQNAWSMLNWIRTKERYRECKTIFEEFERANIRYAVIKGAVLSEAAYGDPYSRCSNDIDILVDREDIDSVKRILEIRNFIQGHMTEKGIERYNRKELLFQLTMSHQTAQFIKVNDNKMLPYINIDINVDILWGESRKKIDMGLVLEYSMSTDICNVSVRKLKPEMEFISLCLHHYKDMNSIYLLSGGSLKLSLFCDIYFYLVNVSINFDQLCTLSQLMDVSQYIYYCLYYTNVIFDNDKISAISNMFYSLQAEQLLNQFGLADWEQQEWKIDFFDRLFMDDIYKYFNEILSDRALKKIEINRSLM